MTSKQHEIGYRPIAAWKAPFLPITVALIVFDIIYATLIITNVLPYSGPAAVIITIAWLAVTEVVYPRLRRFRSQRSN